MADGPELALQAALIAYLRSDAAVAALVGARVYDEPPEVAARPYVRLGNLEVQPVRTDCRRAWDFAFSFEGHSRPDPPMAGSVEARRVARAVIDALDEREAAIAVAGFRIVHLYFVTSVTERASDGESYQCNAAFTARLEPA